MSINLYATCNGVEIKLYQTPTCITEMLCVDENGEINALSGSNAIKALRGYIEWVKNIDDYDKEHIAYIEKLILSGNKIEVSAG